MFIALIIVSIICMVFLFLYIQLRLEVKSLKQQLNYTKEENSSFTLFTSSSDSKVKDIFDEINAIKNEMQEEKNKHLKNEKEIKEMIANISHDIRTPLTSIQGYLEMMQNSQSSIERERYYGIVVRRLDDLHSMLDEFFLYTKLMNTSEPLQLEELEIYPLLCHSILNYMDLLQKQDLAPNIICEEEEIVAYLHEESFQRICMNLIMNTIRYGETPFNIYVKKQGNSIVVIFENGCEKERTIDCKHMFDRFYKEDNARTQKGSGLGLAIVKELVERMQGSVEAKQEENRLIIILRFSLNA